MKALVFGSCNLDIFFSVPHIVAPGETIAAENVERKLGGKGFNQAIALRRAGMETLLAGCVGADGDAFRTYLAQNGVNAGALRTSEIPTGKAYIQIAKDGENSIIIYHGANFAVTGEQVNDTLSLLSPGDAVLLQNEISEVKYIVDRACELGLRTVLNPSPFADEMRKIDLDKISLLLVNETECAQLSGGRSPKRFAADMREKHPGLAGVITLGGKGSLYFGPEGLVRQASYPARVVDTTGAGDTFTGYFVKTYYTENDVKKALDIASRAAAVTVSRIGAAPAIPTAAELG